MNKFLEKYIENKKQREVVEFFLTIILCLMIFFGIRTYVAFPIQADGVSMAPTMDNNDLVLVNRLSYIFSSPKYGDIIIFPYDDNEAYIKRVIGLPGDEVFIEDGYLYINGELYEDEFSKVLTSYGDREYPITLEEDTYYVLGDNRTVSKDSRYSSVGDVKKEDILGKSILVYYPFKNFGFLK